MITQNAARSASFLCVHACVSLRVLAGMAPQRPTAPHVYPHTSSSLLVAFVLPKSNGKPITRIEVERFELEPPPDYRKGESA